MRDERTPDAPILQPVVEAVKVLLVEDHPMMVEGLRISLERAGLAVCGAALTAADGLELARRHQPQVAVLDFNLPDSTGAELAVSLATGRWYVQQAIEKLGTHSKLEAVAKARRLGLLK